MHFPINFVLALLVPFTLADPLESISHFVHNLERQLSANPRLSCIHFEFIYVLQGNVVISLDSLFQSGEKLLTSVKLSGKIQPNVTISTVYKHDQPCPIVLLQIEFLENITAEYWSGFFPKIQMRGYFAFIFTKSFELSQLLEFAKSTPLLQHVYLAVTTDNSTDVFVRGALIQKLIKITSYNDNEAQRKMHELYLRRKYSNYEGAAFIAMVGPLATTALNVFRETGNWIDWSSPIMYELALVFNASLELATVYTLPKKGKDNYGDWDDYTKPLLDGSSAISSTITPSIESNHALLLSRSAHNELVVFITARPKRITVSSLLQLLRPLNTNVWTGMILSIVLIFSALETMMYLKRRRILMQRIKLMFRKPRRRALFEDLLDVEKGMPKHIRILTLYAILQPIIDQNGLTSKMLRKNIQGFWTRFVIGSWFLMLIVVMCAYKSKLIDRIVLPYYTQPPTTFAELADSDYGIGVVFWTGVIEVYFKALNNSVSRTVLQRATEYNFFDDDCYTAIFDGEKACIGFVGLFNRMGLRYMVDIDKQKMFVISKEVLFTIYTSMGLSRHYPELNEPFNQIISSFDAAGLPEIWSWHAEQRSLQKGKRHAEENLDEKPFYNGRRQENSIRYQRSKLLATLVLAGGAVACTLFIFEFVLHYWHQKRVPVDMLPFLF